MQPNLHIRLLGEFGLTYNSHAVASVNTARLQSFMAHLALRRGASQSRQHLAFLFWPDSAEGQARANLRNLAYRLRRALPDADRFLHMDTHNMHLRADSGIILDVADFERALARVERANDATSLRGELEEAIQLYRGPLLPDCYDDWVLPERERLEQAYLHALDRLIELLQKQGNPRDAIRYAELALRHDPLREDSYRQLMELRAHGGDRAGALRAYQHCVSTLQRELEVEPSPPTQAVHNRLLQTGSETLSRHNLPHSTTPFVGRERELASIARWLQDPACRLLALVGPGGIGKTRLALQAAGEQLGAFRDGVYLVTLDETTTLEFLGPALADVLAFPYYGDRDARKQLVEYLQSKEMLLVLDSIEHLAEQAAFLTEVLQGAPHVKMMATSRERLGLQCEWALEIEGLQVPADGSVVNAHQFDAVQLFVQNARRVHPAFTLKARDKAEVVRICQLVEGMPLAIELAAAWTRTLSCREIAWHLRDDLDMLSAVRRDAPARHQSLRRVFDHSWDLLTAEERRLVRGLSVFRSGFTGVAAREVAGATLHSLAVLRDKSILRQDASGQYWMHRLLQQYAEEKLRASPLEAERTQQSYCEYYARFMQQRQEPLRSAGQSQALQEIRQEIENVRVAWRWAIDRGELSMIAQLADSLWHFYELRGWFQEGERVFRSAYETLLHQWGDTQQCDPDKTILLGRLLLAQGWFNYRLCCYERARELLWRSVQTLDVLSGQQFRAFAVNCLATVHAALGEYRETEQLYRQCLSLFREIGDKGGMALALQNLGYVAHQIGQYDQAMGFLSQCLDICEKTQNPSLTANALIHIGLVHRMLGDSSQSETRVREALMLGQQIGYRRSIAYALVALGAIHYDRSELVKARKMGEESLALFNEFRDQRGALYALVHLADVASAMSETESAEATYREALSIAVEIEAYPLMLRTIVGMASHRARTDHSEQAVKLARLACHHPASEYETRERARNILDELGAGDTTMDFGSAAEPVHSPMLDEVVGQLLQ